MRLRVVISVLLSIFISAAPALPQQPAATSPPTDPLAVSLLSQCKASMGAPILLPDIYAAGKITPANPNSPSSTFVTKSKGANRLRNEISLPSGLQVFVVSPGQSFSIAGTQRNKNSSPVPPTFIPEHLAALTCNFNLAALGLTVSYVGSETVSSISVHHIVFQSTSADPLDQLTSELHVYLDASSLQIVKTANWIFAPDALDNRSLWETYYTNYSSIGGLLVPSHISHFLSGNKFDDWEYTSIRTDVPISDGDFQ
jgi:hypothetical protein